MMTLIVKNLKISDSYMPSHGEVHMQATKYKVTRELTSLLS